MEKLELAFDRILEKRASQAEHLSRTKGEAKSVAKMGLYVAVTRFDVNSKNASFFAYAESHIVAALHRWASS